MSCLQITSHLRTRFSEKTKKCLPKQFHNFDCICQFTTDIPHIASDKNVVTDILLQFYEIDGYSRFDYAKLAESQETDEELLQYLEEI